MTLEQLREDMIKAFHTWSRTNDEAYQLRKNYWDDYVSKREAFLKQDAYLKGYKYIPCSELVIHDYSAYRYAMNKLN